MTDKDKLPAPKVADEDKAAKEAAKVAEESAAATAKVHEADVAQQQADAAAGLPVIPADHVTPGYVPEDVEEGSRSGYVEAEPAKK